MPIRLTGDERDFITRVQGYCELGLTEPEMTSREALNLTTFRSRLYRAGFTIDKRVLRRVIRTGSGEPLTELLERGEILATDGPEPAEECAA